MLDINTDALKKFSRQLDNISRSALPVAIRESLNDCAKDMKTNTLLQQSQKSFINRAPNFFKANSGYTRAEGFNVNGMQATTGMMKEKLKGGDNYSVDDLNQQEIGGTIPKKAFIPMLGARKGGARSLVRPNARLKQINNIVKAKDMGFSNPRSNFIVAAHKAGKGGYFLSKNTLWLVKGLNPVKSNDLNLVPLYSFKSNRKVRVKSHHFIEKSGAETHKKIDDFFIARAQKAITKSLGV